MSRIRVFAGMMVLLTLISVPTIAQTTISVDNAVVSRYIWRGFDLTADNNPATQPSVTFTDEKTGIFFNFWNSTGFDRDKTSGADEWDFAAGFSRSLSPLVEVSVGYIYYTFPNLPGPNVSHEFNAGLALGTILSPSLTAYYDAELGRGLYLLGAVEQGLGKIPVTLGLAAGYNSKMFIDDSGISDVTFSASVDIPLPYENFYISPGVYYTVIPEGMQDKGLSDENELWFSVGFGFTF